MSAPEELPYSRIVGKSGRFYDTMMTLPELRIEIDRARRENKIDKLLINNQ
jgi:hypothetical protein